MAPVYMTLQLPRRTAPVSPLAWWALTPPSHPYLPEGRRLFSSALLNPRGLLPVKKWNALCCPDFPHTPQGRKRQADQLSAAKLQKNGRTAKFYCFFDTYEACSAVFLVSPTHIAWLIHENCCSQIFFIFWKSL